MATIKIISALVWQNKAPRFFFSVEFHMFCLLQICFVFLFQSEENKKIVFINSFFIPTFPAVESRLPGVWVTGESKIGSAAYTGESISKLNISIKIENNSRVGTSNGTRR